MLTKIYKPCKRYSFINQFKSNPLKDLPPMETTKKSTARRDGLIELEKEAQKLWETENFYNSNPDPSAPKFLVTFPYPYMNGKLHLGHAFSMTKAEFTARHKKMMGLNVLFPFGFHCTGMPICAAAQKLKSDLGKFGSPPILKEGEKTQQYHILKQMGIADSEIPAFVDPVHWLQYFPPLGKEILKRFGAAIDWRRSFITTDVNAYYNSFIEWQFTQLKRKEKIKFGMRPSIYSVKDKQMCADHDRAEGEGVGPQEYTLIKLKVLEPFPEKMAALAGRKVYLVAATLRPETMYGQTNCFVLPTGVYGAFEMKNDEVFICSERSALNMSYQQLTKTPQQVQKIIDIKGEDIIGLPLNAPLSPYEKVFALPMLSISMGKGTGVVTSVPSDAPDDWASLRDLQKKENFRKKYNLTDEQVLPFEPIPIIEIPEYGNLSALKACDEFKVNSQNDKELLVKAKEKVYLKGFYEGVMLIGKCKGMKVQDAKPIVRKELLEKVKQIKPKPIT